MNILYLKRIVDGALLEDSVFHDPVSNALMDREVRGEILSKEDLIFCGKDVMEEVFRTINHFLSVEFFFQDGDYVPVGSTIGAITGRGGDILRGERVALNFAQRLSGISTLTRRFADKISGTGTKICDTRKTTPTLRILEKYAVRCGGGVNHRFSLMDGIIIKDNAVKAFGSIREAVTEIRNTIHHLLKIEVEVENLLEFKEAIECDVDAILLDNMTIQEVEQAVAFGDGSVILEVSGNITLENIRGYAETGVDYISSGMLTHSAPSADISLEVIK